ncbi:MAG: hypothetical protein CL916_03685 [Deltaproteobacteria bacterium]|nr:hypothetical protein [Deltaproteobacteria bacterium]
MTEFSPSLVQVFSAFLVFTLGLILFAWVRRFFQCGFYRALLIYFWHTLFSLVSYLYVIKFGGDAIQYFRSSLSPDVEFSLGTNAVRFIASIFTQGFGLSLFGCFLVFQIFGAMGLLAFDASLREATQFKSRNIKRLATIIVFLPSLSFWSSALGKDALSFFAAGFALWAALRLRQRWWLLVFAIFVMLLVRPHMAGMMGLGLAGSFLLQRGIPIVQRLLLGGAAVAASLALVPFGLDYAGVGQQAGASEVIEFIESRQNHNLKGGGAVDISGMSPPAQMFTYLFRPTLIEVRDAFSLAAAIDNLILLFLFISGGWVLIKKPLPVYFSKHNRMFLWIYSFIAWVILAMTTANLGIALRQKWMFVPMLIFLFISVIGKNNSIDECQSGDAARRIP